MKQPRVCWVTALRPRAECAERPFGFEVWKYGSDWNEFRSSTENLSRLMAMLWSQCRLVWTRETDFWPPYAENDPSTVVPCLMANIALIMAKIARKSRVTAASTPLRMNGPGPGRPGRPAWNGWPMVSRWIGARCLLLMRPEPDPAHIMTQIEYVLRADCEGPAPPAVAPMPSGCAHTGPALIDSDG